MASDRRPAPISAASPGFGQRLRAARQQRGITLQEISHTTKIPVAMLDALENDKPSRLPGGIFSRSFVRSFANAVGLDPEEALADFQRAFPDDSAPEERRVEEARPAADGRLWPLLLVIVGVIGAVALATAWYRGYGPDLRAVWERIQGPPQATLTGPSQDRPSAQPAPSPGAATAATSTPPPPATASAWPPVTPPPSDQAQPAGAAAAGKAAEAAPVKVPGAPPAADGLVRLSIQPAGPCWVRVTADGTVKLSRLVVAGERVDFGAASRIQLEVGDAGAFAYSIDGRPGRSLGDSGRVVRVTIDTTNAGDFVAR